MQRVLPLPVADSDLRDCRQMRQGWRSGEAAIHCADVGCLMMRVQDAGPRSTHEEVATNQRGPATPSRGYHQGEIADTKDVTGGWANDRRVLCTVSVIEAGLLRRVAH
jgi:hypothetical protein